MKSKLDGLVAVVTGGGGGIGRAICAKLSQYKLDIVLLGGNNLAKLGETANVVRKNGSRCLEIPGDLTDLNFLRQSCLQIVAAFGGIDILINNAGRALSCPYEQVSEDQFDNLFKINIKTPYFLTQYALPSLKKSKRASVINISSAMGKVAYGLQSAYAASKHALQGFTKSLASECYKDNIRVHVICPGGVYTDMVKIARPDLSSDGMIAPEEIADIVDFFLTNRGNAVVDEIVVHRVNKEPFLI